jgi:cbb3-type cytochrome oxidase subunit 3
MHLIYEYAPSASLIFFFLFFLGAAFYAYRPAAKQTMKDHALIPLKEENSHE